MAEDHLRHDGPDHIWQQQSKAPYLLGLMRVEYACACGARLVRVRYAMRGEEPDDERS